MGIFDKGMKKTKDGFFSRLSKAILGKSAIDEDVLDAIEEALIASDMGVDTTMKVIDGIEDRVHRDKYTSLKELADIVGVSSGVLRSYQKGRRFPRSERYEMIVSILKNLHN